MCNIVAYVDAQEKDIESNENKRHEMIYYWRSTKT